ncbi:MAG: hypothetical protein FWC47_10585 [Oscillospiraceae bacterium]|nr:hypothetical protein [Oscillospiraceae bacterium]
MKFSILKRFSDNKIIKKDNIFEHNRYPYEDLISATKNVDIENSKMIVNLPYSFMIKFKTNKDSYYNKLNEVLLDINNFDNIVQEDIRKKYKKFRSNIKRFKAHIAFVEVYYNEVHIEYWGDELRNKFNYVFIKNENGWKMKE